MKDSIFLENVSLIIGGYIKNLISEETQLVNGLLIVSR
jgi:hypothetical protein